MSIHIDMQRIREIIEEYVSLYPPDAYYRKDRIPCLYYVQRFPRNTVDMIAGILSPEFKVPDNGCGDGHTLIEHADRFKEGIGIDESEPIVRIARDRALQSSRNNLRFV